MSRPLTREEFIEKAHTCGWGSRDDAERYCNLNPKKVYDEDEFVEVWRIKKEPTKNITNSTKRHRMVGGGLTTRKWGRYTKG